MINKLAAAIERESAKIEVLSKVEMSERRHDAYYQAYNAFRRPAYQYTELEGRTYEALHEDHKGQV